MLAAARRLRRSAEFAATIRAGRRSGRGAVVVHLAIQSTDADPAETAHMTGTPGAEGAAPPVPKQQSTNPAPPRAGFVVPKAVGNAVTRNRVRRRLRHLVRERLTTLPAGADIVVRALPPSATVSYDQLGRDLDAAIAGARTPRRSR